MSFKQNKHDFNNSPIKDIIEKRFYKIIGQYKPTTTTIVTGPNVKRHVNNFNKYIGGSLRICEINPDIYVDIKNQVNKINQKIIVENKSIHKFGSQFIDCDLTCISDSEVCKKTLLKQLNTMSTNTGTKSFIFSVGLRSSTKSITSIIRPIFGLLGCHISKVIKEKADIGFEYKINGTKGRVREYIILTYNAGGGPMLTVLINYV